jgi:predicted MFS family arabinose efflux permease
MEHRGWLAAWPGLCATLVGVGIGRFSYTPLIPFLIGDGILSETEAAYIGAASLLGYLIGASLAAPAAVRFGMTRAVRATLILATLSLFACMPPLGFWWLLPWRLLSGIAGAILMVLGPSLMLIRTVAGERGRAGGLIYTGVGLGTVIGSLVVAPLAASAPAYAWAALGLAAALATFASWTSWRDGAPLLHPASGVAGTRIAPGRLSLALVCLIAAFGADGAGFVPHTIFWVDFITRELALGAASGAFNWLLFGLGAIVGPFAAGLLGDRLGIGAALIAVFATKALAVAVPTFSAAPPLLWLSSFIVGALSPGIASLISARISQLVEPARQAPVWALATLVFSLAQAGSAYAMSFAFARGGRYLPLYAVGGLIEACGMIACIIAVLAVRRHKAALTES